MVRWIKNNLFTSLLLAIVIGIQSYVFIIGKTSNTVRVASIFPIILLSISLITNKQNFRSILKAVTLFTMLSLSAIFTYLIVLSPQVAESLAVEDGIIENLSVLGLLLACLIMFFHALKLVGSKKLLPALVAFLLGGGFFIIGMEEISWMQRILNIESGEFFIANNLQAETNFHNINTMVFAHLYYFGGFVLLILLPSFYNRIRAMMIKKSSLKKFLHFLPSAWLFVPFSLMVGFVAGGGHKPSINLAIVLTVAILLSEIAESYYKNHLFRLLLLSSTLIISSLIVGVFYFIEYDTAIIRPWAVQEYMELFIALGTLVYAVDVVSKYSPEVKQKPISLKSIRQPKN